MKSIMIQVYYCDGFRRNILCLTEEEYVYHMKMYGFDPEKDSCKAVTKDGKEIEYFFPKTRIMDDKIYRVKEIIVDKNWTWVKEML